MVHGSDSRDSAHKEIAFFFPELTVDSLLVAPPITIADLAALDDA